MYSKVNYAKWHDPSEPLPRISSHGKRKGGPGAKAKL